MASGDESRATRVWLQKQFRTSGLQLDPGALSYLVEAVQGLHDPEEYIHRIMDEASAGRVPHSVRHAFWEGLHHDQGLQLPLTC